MADISSKEKLTDVALGVPASRVPAMIGLGKTATFALIKSGKLESVKIGASRIVTMRSINALLFGEAA